MAAIQWINTIHGITTSLALLGSVLGSLVLGAYKLDSLRAEKRVFCYQDGASR